MTFLGWPDGELEAGLGQRWEVAYSIRTVKPDVVLGHDPWRRYRLHPDHRNAGFLATDGIVAARDPHFFPDQGFPPHRPNSLLLWEAEEPDHVVDVMKWIGFDRILFASDYGLLRQKRRGCGQRQSVIGRGQDEGCGQAVLDELVKYGGGRL